MVADRNKEAEYRQRERDFSTLANPSRVKILLLLHKLSHLTFHRIADEVAIEDAQLSFHIALLKSGGFVVAKKVIAEDGGRWDAYSITQKGRAHIAMIKQMSATMDQLQFKHLSEVEKHC